MTKSEDVIITQDAERSDVFALVELLADGQKPRALNVPVEEDAPSPGEADRGAGSRAEEFLIGSLASWGLAAAGAVVVWLALGLTAPGAA